MVETKITCDKCGKDIEGCYYSEVQIVGKYRQTNNKPEDIYLVIYYLVPPKQ